MKMNETAILIVDDEPLILLDLESALEEAGFLTVGVPTAEAAIEAFAQQPDRISALLTDVRLGVGKSGWDLARDFRRVTPTLPVVYISGDSSPNWSAEGVPGSVIIPKPVFMPQIITALSNLLNRLHPIALSDEGA